MKGFWQFFLYFNHLSVWYNRIVNDPDKREKSVYFGARSIISSLVGAIIIILCAFGISALMNNENALTVVFMVLLAVAMISVLFECTLRGLVTMIYQLRVNKRPIGWIALTVFVVSFVAMVLLSSLLIAKVI